MEGIFPISLTKALLAVFAILVILKSSAQTSDHASIRHSTPSGKQIIVLDGIVCPSYLTTLRNYVMTFSNWQLCDTTPDKHLSVTSYENHTQKNHCFFPWSAKLNRSLFEETHFWKTFSEFQAVQNFYPSELRAEILRRGDPVQLQQGLDNSARDEYSWRVFLTPDWRINDYGDLTFYEGNGELDREVVLTVSPRFGRVVLWHSSLSVMYHPPSMSYIEELLSISGKMTYKTEPEERVHTESQANIQHSFPAHLSDPAENLDLDSKRTRLFKDNKGRTLAVYDNIFSDTDLQKIQNALQAQGKIGYNPYDLEPEEDSDNAQWITMFDPERFTDSAVWKILSQIMRHASKNRSLWHPYDVSLNIVRTADHTRIHQDCEEWEDEYTMVLYLNPDWRPEFYGETVFFEAKPGSELSKRAFGVKGEIDYQPFAAVLPKYGRLAVFQGIIPHSARPPSSAFSGVRYTFAVKVAVTRKVALSKRLRETLEDKFDELSSEQKNLRDLDDLDMKSKQWLDQELQEMLRKADAIKQREKVWMQRALFTGCGE